MKHLFCSLILTFSLCSSVIACDSTFCSLRDAEGRYREHNVDFKKMVLQVSFKPTEGKVLGKVSYEFTPIMPLIDSIFLNAPAIDIKSVSVNGVKSWFLTDSLGVTIQLKPSLKWESSNKMEIEYEATPRRGIYFIGWNEVLPAGKTDENFIRKQIWTQGQGIDNRHWIPCYDDVNDKMLTETIITFDSSYTVVSNGNLKSVKVNANGTKTWHYAMNKPHVPYLIMLAIDKYKWKDIKSNNGVVSRQYYYAERPETFWPMYQYSKEMMDWLPKETGVPYPWDTYANVPVQEFLYGAMENTTATIFTDYYSMDYRQSLDRNYLATNAHELTHQWFGDLVTEWSGTHHWLHESFATYYAKHFVRVVKGNDEYNWNRRGEMNSALAADRNDRFPVAHTKGGSARHYPKGSFVIDMLRYVAGDEVFKKAIKHFLTKHAYSNVDTHDFWRSFMECCGVNFDWFFEQWIYRSGYPMYKVEFREKGDHYMFTIEQKQKTDELTAWFRMPVVFELYFGDGTKTAVKDWVEGQFDTLRIPKLSNNKEVSFWIFDAGGHVLKTIEQNKNYRQLVAQAERADAMLDRYDALVELRSADIEAKRADLIRLYAKSDFYVLKNEIIEQLSNDRNGASLELLRAAMRDKELLVRRATVESPKELSDVLLSDYEKLLEDSSYQTIETALRKLCKSFPNQQQRFLEKSKEVFGTNKNVRITWLEIKCADKNERFSYVNELIEYASPRYEFRTRVKAMEALERLQYADKSSVLNMMNAAVNANNRLANPAANSLRSLLNNTDYKNLARWQLQNGNWTTIQRETLQRIIGER